ncbi:uncharacterized protein [Ptychodera flava]|uniref:uncharacterized protein n=1 Tax=Ptychodera flava TaxID=63121 RepID=UPI00396A16B6
MGSVTSKRLLKLMKRSSGKDCGYGFVDDGLGGCFPCDFCKIKPLERGCDKCEPGSPPFMISSFDTSSTNGLLAQTTNESPISDARNGITPHTKPDYSANGQMLLVVPVALVLVCAVMLLWYWFRNRDQKKTHHDIEETDVKRFFTACTTFKDGKYETFTNEPSDIDYQNEGKADLSDGEIDEHGIQQPGDGIQADDTPNSADGSDSVISSPSNSWNIHSKVAMPAADRDNERASLVIGNENAS